LGFGDDSGRITLSFGLEFCYLVVGIANGVRCSLFRLRTNAGCVCLSVLTGFPGSVVLNFNIVAASFEVSFNVALQTFGAGKRFLCGIEIIFGLCSEIGTVLFGGLESFLLCRSTHYLGV
jgi:hypothetical protein